MDYLKQVRELEEHIQSLRNKLVLEYAEENSLDVMDLTEKDINSIYILLLIKAQNQENEE